MICIVDSGGANIASILFALQRLGVEAILSDDPQTIRQASHVILPGVGAAKPAMKKLAEKNLMDVIRHLTQPVLGICLGMQLLFEFSAEGSVDCLGIIPGKVEKLPATKHCRIPHMGWNTVEIIKENNLLKNHHDKNHLYFVHSFYAPVNAFTIATGEHGTTFAAMVKNRNFYGIQAHPERSGTIGAALLKNFLLESP